MTDIERDILLTEYCLNIGNEFDSQNAAELGTYVAECVAAGNETDFLYAVLENTRSAVNDLELEYEAGLARFVQELNALGFQNAFDITAFINVIRFFHVAIGFRSDFADISQQYATAIQGSFTGEWVSVAIATHRQMLTAMLQLRAVASNKQLARNVIASINAYDAATLAAQSSKAMTFLMRC